MDCSRRTMLAIALPAAIASGMLGCGGTDERTNRLRPPVPILLSAAITPERIAISPRTAGAGPITVVVTNLTGSSQQVTFESARIIGSTGTAAPGIRQQTGPINPNDTATLKATVRPGTYRMRVSGDTVAPATLAFGRERPSAQNDLMLP